MLQNLEKNKLRKTWKKFEACREAKFKTSLRVGFFLDFRNFIFASSAARIKKYSYRWLIYQSKAISFHFSTEKNLKSELWYFCGKQTNKIQLFEILCVHTQDLKSWNLVCLFSTEILQFWFQFFFRAKTETYGVRLIY